MTAGTFVEVAAVTEAARTSVRAARPPLRRRLARLLPPYLYLLPGLGCVGFWVYRPLVQSVQLSFYNWNLLPSNPKTPVGLANYTQLFDSPQLGSSLWLTVLFILGMVPFTLIIPTVVGLFTRRLSGKRAAVYRFLIFTPVLVPPVAGAVLW